jgi:transcriptional regulator GlxA family with amidase domain
MSDRSSSVRNVVRSLVRARAANDAEAPASSESFDPHVARALAAMKADPARRWTVAALARIAGLSRAPFARRFAEAVGAPPMRWLTEHRLRLAGARLVGSDDGLAAIAVEIGYASEFAFAKAFKRLFRVAPGRFRRFSRTDHVATFRAAA